MISVEIWNLDNQKLLFPWGGFLVIDLSHCSLPPREGFNFQITEFFNENRTNRHHFGFCHLEDIYNQTLYYKFLVFFLSLYLFSLYMLFLLIHWDFFFPIFVLRSFIIFYLPFNDYYSCQCVDCCFSFFCQPFSFFCFICSPKCWWIFQTVGFFSSIFSM